MTEREPITIQLTEAEMQHLLTEMDRRAAAAAQQAVDTYEATQYRSFLSLLPPQKIAGIIDALLLKEEDSDGKTYLHACLKELGPDRFEQFIDRLYEESDQGTHMTLSDLGADGGPIFTRMFSLRQPSPAEMSYVDSVTRRDAMRRVGKTAMQLLAADAVLGAASVGLYSVTNEDDKKQRRRLENFEMLGVVPVAVVCSGVIAWHYNYENKIDHIDSQLEQIERKLQAIEAAVNQLVKVSRGNARTARPAGDAPGR